MDSMTRAVRTLAAVLAALALVAALPAACGCTPARVASEHADAHACCAPPTGVSAAARGCCDEAPAAAAAVPLPTGPAAVAPVATVLLGAEASSTHRMLGRLSVFSAVSPPPTVLRI
jgi:hypothetical protein